MLRPLDEEDPVLLAEELQLSSTAMLPAALQAEAVAADVRQPATPGHRSPEG